RHQPRRRQRFRRRRRRAAGAPAAGRRRRRSLLVALAKLALASRSEGELPVASPNCCYRHPLSRQLPAATTDCRCFLPFSSGWRQAGQNMCSTSSPTTFGRRRAVVTQTSPPSTAA
ncbi:unnamed protein product, partial [Phaeothamnion confervicola]